jgi:hypothetical protein
MERSFALPVDSTDRLSVVKFSLFVTEPFRVDDATDWLLSSHQSTELSPIRGSGLSTSDTHNNARWEDMGYPMMRLATSVVLAIT